MDYLRSGYTIDMQFDREGTIVVPVTWYAAAEGARHFSGRHHFVSTRTWSPHQLPTLGLGERWDSAPTYYNSAPPYYSPGTGGVCGPIEWFREGCPSDAPPIQYSAAGIPTCCPQPPCQPWGFGSSGTRSCTGVVYHPGLWIDAGGDSGFEEFYFFPFGGPDVITVEFSFGACPPSVNSTEATCYFLDYPTVEVLTLQSYDPATSTGVWIDPTGTLPAGTQFLIKIPLP